MKIYYYKVLRCVCVCVCYRVISRAPGLKLVVQTLLSSLRPIGNIVLICCTFFIIFGILGVQVRGPCTCLSNHPISLWVCVTRGKSVIALVLTIENTSTNAVPRSQMEGQKLFFSPTKTPEAVVFNCMAKSRLNSYWLVAGMSTFLPSTNNLASSSL